MNITIRTMALDEVEAVSILMAGCYTFLAAHQGFTSLQLESLIAERCSTEWIRQATAVNETYVAMSGGAIVGLVGIQGNELAELWVTPRLHRAGIGALLFSKVEQLLRQRGFTVLTVHTTGYAIPFYEAMGAHVVGRRVCDCGPLNGWVLTYLEKELKMGENATSVGSGGDGEIAGGIGEKPVMDSGCF